MNDLKRPKLVRDWENGFVRSHRQVSTRVSSMPAGAIFKVTSSGITAHLTGMPCSHCGIKMHFTMKGKNKFRDFEWLGYKHPHEQVEPTASTPQAGEVILKTVKYRKAIPAMISRLRRAGVRIPSAVVFTHILENDLESSGYYGSSVMIQDEKLLIKMLQDISPEGCKLAWRSLDNGEEVLTWMLIT